jgi:rsbT antagonist protein RsbS
VQGNDSSIVFQPIGNYLVVPLQGPVHEELLVNLGDDLMDYIHQFQPRGVVLDMAGIQVLDRHDFERLTSLIKSATLLGPAVVISSVQPGVAAGLSMLNVDFSSIRATRTVEQAMALLQ